MNKRKKTGGRIAGTPNKMTPKVKEALALAFEGLGGVESLMKWGKDNQTEFYRLWARMLPQEVRTNDLQPATAAPAKRESDYEFARKVAFVLAAGEHEMRNKAASLFGPTNDQKQEGSSDQLVV